MTVRAVGWVLEAPAVRSFAGLRSLNVLRVAALTATGLLLLFAAFELVAIYQGASARGEVGWDVGLYVRIGQRWLDTGSPYLTDQLSAAYVNSGEVDLYPPIALYLFAPFTVLPTIVWWIVPAAVVIGSVIYWRPTWWAWPAIASIMALPPFGIGLVYGNSTM